MALAIGWRVAHDRDASSRSGATFHGRTSFERHEGGAFVLKRSEIDEPEIPGAVAVIGSDDAPGTFTMVYFGARVAL